MPSSIALGTLGRDPWMVSHSLPNVLPSGRLSSVEEGIQKKIYSVSLSNLKKHADYANYHFKPSPFYARWVHGYNHKAGVVNLNDKGSTVVFYAASNYGILYNWTTNRMRILQGHRHLVTCIATDSKGQWLVTADSGSENVIIVWDYRDVFPYRTIFAPHRNLKLARIALSGDAKYLLTLAYDKDRAHFNWWIWSFGLETPHAEGKADIMKDSIIDMSFNPASSDQFALITKTDLWIGISEQLFTKERGEIRLMNDYQIKIRCAERKGCSDVGRLTCFCFVTATSQIIVGTNRGVVLIYGCTMEYSHDVDTTKFNQLKFVKPLKIQKFRINVIKYVDDVVVTGNRKGQIHFYDDQMKLLYWVHGFTVNSVSLLSFNISPRSYVVLDPKCKKICPCWEKVVLEKDPVTGLTANKLLKNKIPTDTTKGGLPFVIRDFIVGCPVQGIGFVDFVPEKNHIILDYQVSPVLALTVHPEKMLVCLGYLDGHVELVNFAEHKVKMKQTLREYYKVISPPDDDSVHGEYKITIPRISVTCLKYSPSGLHLACGLNTGELIFLDPATIEIKTPKPFKDTQHTIKEIAYSPDSLTLAFADAGRTVCVYKYNCDEFHWTFIGKHRAHYKDITALLFLSVKNADGDYKLLSFGLDRVMVEYDIGQSNDEHLEIFSLDRMDQSAMPLAAIEWPRPEGLDPELCHTHVPTVLVSNDEHKYKIVNYETMMTLATYLGPRFEHPVRFMQLVTKKDDHGSTTYLLFATKIVIGLQKLPLDGNPWKHVGLLGHPNQLIKLCFRDDSGILFTIGAKDSCMTQWRAHPRSVEKTTQLGGIDLDPYYCLIENGRPGWLFQEIRDLFYYIQILCQGTFSPAMRRVKDVIPIDSLPDLMRALGFFLTEYEVENLLIEAKYEIYNKEPRLELDFEEFVKLYINHRPAFLTTSKKVRASFRNFATVTKREGEIMKREDFVNVLCTHGEVFSRELAWYLLSILCGQSFEDRASSSDEDFSFLPKKIKLGDFTTTILGIPDFDTISEGQSFGPSVISAETDNSSAESDHGDFLNSIFHN